MKIDIHVHTRKVKSGDADTRNIEPERFGEIIKDTDVKILAITNHNFFDLDQFGAITDVSWGTCQIWPGIELDILENGKRAHLLVIVNPKNAKEFSRKASEILSGKSPDSFTITLKETVDAFDDLDCLYIAHYFVKKPDLGDKEIETLSNLISHPKRILKEATNSISAGIYISHGHNSIYGSDVQDWDRYSEVAKTLPELRLPVESFEQFCLLLEKDEATIETILSKKMKESIQIVPFSAAEAITLIIYNDINILFGSKGTGKTEILESLSKYFNARGHKTNVYKSNDTHLNDVFDIRGARFSLEKADLTIDECEKEIKFLKAVKDEKVTSLSKYRQHFNGQETNKIAQRLKIKDIVPADESHPGRKLQEVSEVLENFTTFKSYVEENDSFAEYGISELVTDLLKALDAIIAKLRAETATKFLDAKSIVLLNHLIETFVTEISKKKPASHKSQQKQVLRNMAATGSK